jgi:hypothetical protein
MLAISRTKPTREKLAVSVLAALEITRPGPGVFARRDKAWRDAAIAEHVFDLVVGKGQPVKQAIYEVATDRKMKAGAVGRAWRSLYGRRIGRPDGTE